MAGMGVDVFCVRRFTRQVAGQQPEAFLQSLQHELHPAAVVAGFNYTFGDRGRGGAALLQAMGGSLGWQTDIVPEVILDGATVSSTRIRLLLENGRVREANRLLGRAYSAAGMLTERDGCPALPLRPGKVSPRPGVYHCWLQRPWPQPLILRADVRVTEDRLLLPQSTEGSLPAPGERIRILFYE